MSDNDALQHQAQLFHMPPEKFNPNLADKYIVPPFSVLDTKQGYWQDRKRAWLSLGIKSELGRSDELVLNSEQLNSEQLNFYRNKEKAKTFKARSSLNQIMGKKDVSGYETGTSIFDPVLCELMYKWFCPVNGQILDPFAGGSVRGIVAGVLDYNYIGIDLAVTQIEANYAQAKQIIPDKNVMWIVADSYQQLDQMPDNAFDFVFSCPPYFDLEVYSDDPADLSNMTWDGFSEVYRAIIAKTVAKLKINRFACFVVGNVRDKHGFYHDLAGETIEAFEAAGCRYYNEIILVNVIGSLPVRMTKQFEAGRKVGKMHQNVLVFYKGDPKEIRSIFSKHNEEENTWSDKENFADSGQQIL
jgi:DNA modification methylase